MIPAFETDLDPATCWPRIRINYPNGWTASILIRTAANRMDGQLAALAAWPTGRDDPALFEAGEQEASPAELVDFLNAVRDRPSRLDRGPLNPRLDVAPLEPQIVCHACGCRETDRCLHGGEPCRWVAADLCSRCDALGQGRAAA